MGWWLSDLGLYQTAKHFWPSSWLRFCWIFSLVVMDAGLGALRLQSAVTACAYLLDSWLCRGALKKW